jgi:hypothetical protein
MSPSKSCKTRVRSTKIESTGQTPVIERPLCFHYGFNILAGNTFNPNVKNKKGHNRNDYNFQLANPQRIPTGLNVTNLAMSHYCKNTESRRNGIVFAKPACIGLACRFLQARQSERAACRCRFVTRNIPSFSVAFGIAVHVVEGEIDPGTWE